MNQQIHLVRRFQCGDRAAFEELLRNEAPRLLNFVRKHVHTEDMAQDFFQEICIRVWRFREQLRDGEKFHSWLYQIARRTIMEFLRMREWTAEVGFFSQDKYLEQFMDDGKGPREEAQLKELRKLIDREVCNLDDSFRQILVLRYTANLNLREISTVLNVPYGTVCFRMSQAAQHLRKRLKALGVDVNSLQ
ncbi:sigma-70 family RNA polymerase sigma factor [Candidatus Sumerlaeota bacterium]|nr:sigma-70 family RNA polymerase sigma factor [Candidatus Sumerlaeota bacterium]